MLDRLRPAVRPDADSKRVFESQLRLAKSEWFTAEEIEAYQLLHLKNLVRFAARNVPFWRSSVATEAIERAATLHEALSALPILSRAALRDNLTALRATDLPSLHQAAGERTSSGSTGMVVAVTTSNVMLAWQHALAFRPQLWAGRDMQRAIALIRKYPKDMAEYPEGLAQPHWAPPSVFPFATGPAFLLTTSNTSLAQQWEWLERISPSYLMTYPSIVRAFAERAAAKGKRPALLRGITTIGEVVDPELRELAVRYLDAPIYDIYSSEEAGTMALQCPNCTVYHVQVEALILEVLDPDDRPCRPGETGRVVVTPLFNYAMPLLRYELGDFALVGEPCPCGRALPVLERIMGRRRNMLTLPDGRSFWPSFSARRLQKIVPIREHQFRQTAPLVIEALLVTEAPISPAQESAMRDIINAGLPMGFDIRIRCLDAIPRPTSGKYEEFVSAIEPLPVV